VLTPPRQPDVQVTLVKDWVDLKPAATFSVGGTIGRLLLAPDGKALYYLDLTGWTAGKLRTPTLERVATKPLSRGTLTLAMSPDGKVLVAPWETAAYRLSSRGLQVLDTATFASRASIPLDGAPHDVAVGDGMAYVSRRAPHPL